MTKPFKRRTRKHEPDEQAWYVLPLPDGKQCAVIRTIAKFYARPNCEGELAKALAEIARPGDFELDQELIQVRASRPELFRSI